MMEEIGGRVIEKSVEEGVKRVIELASEKIRTKYGEIRVEFNARIELREEVSLDVATKETLRVIEKLGLNKKYKNIYSYRYGEAVINFLVEYGVKDFFEFGSILELIDYKFDSEEIYGEEILKFEVPFVEAIIFFASPERIKEGSLLETFDVLRRIGEELQENIPVRRNLIFLRIRNGHGLESLKEKVQQKLMEKNVEAHIELGKDTEGLFLEIRLGRDKQVEVIEEEIFRGLINKLLKCLKLKNK